jgi:TRAP-type C4-dicarboxylate transport system permease small subunit
MMIWLTFIGSGMVMRYGGHIAVENLQDAFPRPVGQAIRVLVASC